MRPEFISSIRKYWLDSSPDFTNSFSNAFLKGERVIQVYGFSGVGKSQYFQKLYHETENCSYIDCGLEADPLKDLLSNSSSTSEQIYILDHLSTKDKEAIELICRQARQNVFILVSSQNSLALGCETFKIPFYPMGTALASLVVSTEICRFQNHFQVEIPWECREFISTNHFGLRGFIHRFLEICKLGMAEPSGILSDLQETSKTLLTSLPMVMEYTDNSLFPYGLEASALVRVKSLWLRIQAGLVAGWASAYCDSYILHGGFNRISIPEDERLELLKHTRDLLRQYFLLHSEKEKNLFLIQNPVISSFVEEAKGRIQGQNLAGFDMEELKQNPDSPLAEALLTQEGLLSNPRVHWISSVNLISLQALFEDALRRDDSAYLQYWQGMLASLHGGVGKGDFISYLQDWQAQIYLRQGHFKAAQHFWEGARRGASHSRDLQILLHQYLTFVADLDFHSAIEILKTLENLAPDSLEKIFALGVDRIIAGDLEGASVPLDALEKLEASGTSHLVRHYLLFLGYLEQKVNSPWTYIRFNSPKNSSSMESIPPGLDFLFAEIDRRFCLCFNRNGQLEVSHRYELEKEYVQQLRYDLFFDFHNERYYEKDLGLLKIEKSRITLMLFCLLAFFPGRRFSWKELYEAIYRKSYNAELDEGTIRMAVTRMKKALEPSNESYFGISLVNQELYLKASTKYCVIIPDEEIQEINELALALRQSSME